MRVCFVSRKFPPTLSGMSTYAYNLCTSFVARGVDLTVLAQYRPDPLGNSVYGDGAPVPLAGARVIGMPQVNEAARGDFEADIQLLVERIAQLHEEQPFDVIHAQYGYPPGTAATLAGLQLGLPVAVSLQGGDGHWFGTCCRQHHRTMEWTMRHASAILLPTASFQARVVGRYGHIGEQQVLPGAVDVRRFAFDAQQREAWRHKLDIANDQRVVIYHGRLDDRKGVRELIRAYAALPAELRDGACLVVAGVGPDAATLAQLASASLPASTYRWLGLVAYDDIPGLLSAGDLHCSPTYQEGFSNTLVEAAACGLPLLSTATVGVADVFEHGKNAWLVPIEDSAALSEAMAHLLADEGLRRQLGANARDLVTREYSWARLADRLLALYPQLEPVVGSDLPPARDLSESCRYRDNPVLL